MSSKYQEAQRQRGISLIKNNSPVFYGAKGGRMFRGKPRDFFLTDFRNNLFAPVREEVIKYFKQNKVAWWGGKNPTSHILSSQIACVNHLYALRIDKEAVLALLKVVSEDFIDVLPIDSDKYFPGYIQFEAVSDNDYLNEGKPTRGNNCTSVDALIYALHKDGTKWLIPIEWKYTEHYFNTNKATEGFKKDPVNCKGEVRKQRYSELINDSAQLKSDDHFCYYFEPFYQLMRQTLWAEQMVKNKARETLKADNFLHLHIIPEDNANLLHKKYKCSGKDMETTWRQYLHDTSKYKILAPENFLERIDRIKYQELISYLTIRYWNK